MHSLLGFEPDGWDYLAIACIFLLVVAGLAIAVFVLGLPGRIAIARKHPDADAVNLMGWAGFLTVVPWLKALGWAFKPTEVIDVRYMPGQEQRNIDEEIAKLRGKPLAKATLRQKDPGPAQGEPKVEV